MAKTLAIVIDQESTPEQRLKESIEEKMRDYGIQYQLASHDRRLWIYRYSVGPREFQLITIVNGLDRDYIRHTIEDYLLEAARLMGHDVDKLVL